MTDGELAYANTIGKNGHYFRIEVSKEGEHYAGRGFVLTDRGELKRELFEAVKGLDPEVVASDVEKLIDETQLELKTS